jgi:hypothetical protein
VVGALLIVGADHLGAIPDKLLCAGFDEVLHINGRKDNAVKKGFPQKIEGILVLIDYVNHNLSNVIKKWAKSQAIPIYYAKRSWSSIHKALLER